MIAPSFYFSRTKHLWEVPTRTEVTRSVFLGRLLVALKRAGFILAYVQSDVLSPSCMQITAFSIDQQHRRWERFVMLPHVSMRRCFKSPVSRHFRRSYLRANKVSKSEGTMKVEYAYNFWKCADAVEPKLPKLVRAWRNRVYVYTMYRLSQTLNVSWEKTPESVLYASVQAAIDSIDDLRLIDFTSTENICLSHLPGIVCSLYVT